MNGVAQHKKTENKMSYSNMKHVLLILVALLGMVALNAAPAASQTATTLVIEVRGESDNTPILGAIATLDGRASYQIRTGPSGDLSFSSIPAGEYRLIVRAVGFLTVEQPLRLRPGANERVKVEMEGFTAPIEFDPVSVTATRAPSPRLTTPASVSVLEDATLRALQPQNIDDILSTVPNVTTVGGPRAVAQAPQVRGLGSDRLVLRVDGARQNFQTGHKGRMFIEPALLKRVEVVRGATSSLYGSGGLAGAIAFETKDALDYLEPGETLAVDVMPGVRSSSAEYSGMVTVAGRAGPADAVAGFITRDGDNIRLSDGSDLPYSAAEYKTYVGSVGFGSNDGHRVKVSFRRFEEDSRTPLNANTNTTDSSNIGDRATLAQSLRFSYDLSSHRLPWLDARAVGYRDESEVAETRLSDGRADKRTVTTYGVDVTGTARARINGLLRIALTGGFEYFNDDNVGLQNGGLLANFPDGSAAFYGAFAQAQIQVTQFVTLAPGIRYDSYESSSVDPANRANESSEAQLKLAALVHPTPFLTIFGSFAEGFNAPRLQDLYISGMHFPAAPGAPYPNNFFTPNPDMTPERADTYEVGARLSHRGVLMEGDGVEAEFTYFEVDARDFIAREVNLMGGTTTFRNLDEVELDGIEARLAYNTPVAYGAVSFGRTRGRDILDDAPIDDIPADSWVFEAGVKPFGDAVVVGWRTMVASDQDRVTDPELATPGYAAHDAFLRVTPAAGSLGRLSLWARLNNVFDKEFRRHGSAILAPGRDLRLGSTYHIGLFR